MFIYDPSIYRIFKSRVEFTGSDVFELFPGDFAGEVKWWNEGSRYIREDGFEPFNELVLGVAPDFDWYGETRIAGAQLKVLLGGLEAFGRGLRESRSAADPQRLSWRISVDDESFKLVRPQLIRTVEDIAAVVWEALSRRRSLWVLGL